MDERKLERRAETVYIALILAIAVVLWWQAGKLPPAPYDPLGPGAFPRWVSYGLAGLAAAMIVRRLLGRSLGRAAQSMVTGLDGAAGHVLKPGIAAATLVASLGYAVLMGFKAIPFFAATAVYLFVAGALLGPPDRRRLAIVGVFAVVAAAVLDYLFRRVFSLDLN